MDPQIQLSIQSQMPRKGPLYPHIEPYTTFKLPVHNFHELYVELIVLVTKYNKGGGTTSVDRRYFNPQKYRIVVFHQRGAGKSKPAASIEDNDTQSLIYDIEKIRNHCNIERWIVFGGSWGSTLALAYAIEYPYRVRAMILRGIFLLRPRLITVYNSELKWYYQEGASNLFPDHWEKYISIIPPEERHDMIAAYYKRLTSPDEKVMLAAAREWSRWEMATSKLEVDQNLLDKVENPLWALQFARIECHYFINKGFFKTDNYILENIDKIKDIPCHIVQGRYG
ncbi:hypothetical protein HDV01_004501 [Terramyces sp. JEL0728]|nr:hypothetical protein HDV01_004501 [Terramyces sp. JEL0728]